MAIYAFECRNCGSDFEKNLPMAKYDEPQACPDCGGESQRIVVPVNFVLKGDGWTGKNLRIKSQMTRKNERLKRRQKDHVGPGPQLAPNVDGERVESWTEAKKLAASQGKAADSYDHMIRKERGDK